MEHVGYSLIDNKNKEIQFWGELGMARNMPDIIRLPSGTDVHSMQLYETIDGYTLVKRLVDANPPSIFHTKLSQTSKFVKPDVVVTYTYSKKADVVPNSVTAVQFRKALNQLNLRNDINKYIEAQEQDTQDTWEYAIEIQRQNPLIEAAATALGKTTEEVDDLFRLAHSL